MKPPRWFWLALLLTLARPSTGHRPIRAARIDPPPGGPNLLIIIGDDHAGGTLGIDGDPRRATPRLDRLARQGTRFSRAYCNSPLCTPSRQSFITGKLPHAVGVTQLTTRLPDDALTLGQWLGGLGYATGAVGKMHFNGPSSHGFAERVDTPDWERWLKEHPPAGGDRRRPWRPFRDPSAVWLNASCQPAGLPESAMEATFFADRAAEFLERHRREPFALVVGFHEPHSPFVFPDEWAGRYHAEDFPVPPVTEAERRDQPLIFKDLKPDEIRGIQAAYYTSLSFVDHEVGRVLDALDRSGLADNTIVVYLGDNGYMLGQHGRFEKHCFYEPSVRVPLIVRWPGHVPADREVKALVELVDVFPTLMELGQLRSPPGLQGRSLVPVIDGKATRHRRVVFSEYLENEEAMVRDVRYKLIVGTGQRKREDGYVTENPTPGPYERLYDLMTDPDETTDVSGRPDLAPIRDRLRHRLYQRLIRTRGDREPVPPGLSESEAIRWSLVPRDLPAS